MRRIILFILSVLITLGCSNGTPKPPSWYGKNEANASLLVGFGSAKTLDAAKANALSDIITQINVEVSSQFSSNTQRQDNLMSYNSSNDVWLNSAGIELNDVRYTKDAFENDRFYIRAEIPKSSLISQFKKQFDSTYNALNMASLNKCSTLSIKDKVRLEKALGSLRLYGTLLQTLNAASKPITSLENMLSHNAPLPTARLIVESNMPNDIITSDLAKELGYFYSLDGEATQVLKAKVHVEGANNGIKISLIFSIFDCRNNPIFNTSLDYTHYAASFDEALRFASQRVSVQLYKKIQEWIERP